MLVWRKLQRLGAAYLQDGICILPSRAELDENFQYIATTIEEIGGTCHLFKAGSLLPGGDERLVAEFRGLADSRLEEILGRLTDIQRSLSETSDPDTRERAEEELKRERIAFLRARRLAYFGSSLTVTVDQHLDTLKQSLDGLYRSDT
jgi:hypothetical protein